MITRTGPRSTHLSMGMEDLNQCLFEQRTRPGCLEISSDHLQIHWRTQPKLLYLMF